MSCWFLARGPITAVFLAGLSGRIPPWFWSSTIERPAALRAAATASGRSICASACAGVNGAYGCSNRPARNLTRRILRTASSTPLHRDPAFLQQLRAEVADQRARHLGVHAGVERERRGTGSVGGDSVPAFAGVGCLRRAGSHLGHGGPVALDEPVEVPFVLQDLVHQLVVATARHAVDRVERAHNRVRAGIDRGLEGRQVEVPEPLDGHVGRVVVAAALGLAIGREVLGARNELVGRAVVRPLNRLDARCREHRVQVGILAGGLGDPAPARFVGDVDHRGVGLLEPDDCRLARAVLVVVGRHLRVEARPCGERDREHRPEPVDRVEGKEDWDLEPRLLDGHALEVSDPLWVGHAQDRAETLAHAFVGDQEVRQELDLLQLLLGRHLRKQRVDARLDAVIGWVPCGLECLLVARLRRGDDAPAIAVPSARIDTASQSLGLNLDMGSPLPRSRTGYGRRLPPLCRVKRGPTTGGNQDLRQTEPGSEATLQGSSRVRNLLPQRDHPLRQAEPGAKRPFRGLRVAESAVADSRLREMERAGIEPATSALQTRRSPS